jgi:hypothetical protein
MNGQFVYGIFFFGAGLMFWPVFQLIHRRWSPRAKRLFIVFLITLGALVGYASLLIGPWKVREAFAPIFWMPIINLVSLLFSTLVCKANPAERLPRSIRWIGIVLAVLFHYQMGYARFILDWQGQPVCHKNLMAVLKNWVDDHDTNVLPNVHGIGRDSLAELRPYGFDAYLEQRYGYVAGLRKDDPGDLVLMYLNQPTRWVWHGIPHTIFTKKAWIIVPVDFTVFTYSGRQITKPGECSETVSREEFRVRLRRTLDFVRTNERPNWKAVVAEHTKFLNSIEDENR